MKYPNAASTGAWLSSGGWKVSHPGLVVSEGSGCLLISGCCRAYWWTSGALLWRMFARLLCCGGTGRWHTSYFKREVWGRNEDWYGKKMARQPIGHSTHILSFTHTWHLGACLYIYIYICMGMIQGATWGGRELVGVGASSVIRAMWYNCIWSPNKQGISPSPWWRWQMWWTSALAARTTLDLLKIIDLLFASQVGDK